MTGFGIEGILSGQKADRLPLNRRFCPHHDFERKTMEPHESKIRARLLHTPTRTPLEEIPAYLADGLTVRISS